MGLHALGVACKHSAAMQQKAGRCCGELNATLLRHSRAWGAVGHSLPASALHSYSCSRARL
jgi:hypothetical protein